MACPLPFSHSGALVCSNEHDFKENLKLLKHEFLIPRNFDLKLIEEQFKRIKEVDILLNVCIDYSHDLLRLLAHDALKYRFYGLLLQGC